VHISIESSASAFIPEFRYGGASGSHLLRSVTIQIETQGGAVEERMSNKLNRRICLVTEPVPAGRWGNDREIDEPEQKPIDAGGEKQ
jgi:hypothetical protein